MVQKPLNVEIRRARVTAGLSLGLFLAALEATVVATAMPKVIAELGGEHLYSLPFAIYLLLATATGPLWGYASDLYGRRRLYLAAVGLFLIGSALSGAARSMAWLIEARAVQGLGAGGLQTLTFTIIGELYPMQQRSHAQGIISGVWGLSALIGPLVGGFIVDHLSWRWVFYLNVPFGLTATALVKRWHIDLSRRIAKQVDALGAAIFTAGTCLLVYGLQTRKLRLVLAGMAVLVAFPFWEARQVAPLVPLKALNHPLMARSVAGNFLGGMAFFGYAAYLPLFAQMARGHSATASGMLLSPITLGWTVSSILSARLLPRRGPRPLSLWGVTGMIAGFTLWALFPGAPLWILGASGLVSGLGMGAVMLALLVSTQEEAPREALGSVTATLLFARNVGGSLGSAVMGALLGAALELGGSALAQAFWRVPGLSTLLAAVMLVIVAGVPNSPVKSSDTEGADVSSGAAP